MATPFRLKRSAIEGKRPAESDLQRGELALNTYDGYLYTEREGVGLSTVTNLTPWYENYGGGSIYYSNSVGIGTTVPQYKLDVRKGSIGGYDDLRAPHSDVIVEIEVTVANKTDDHRYQGSGSNSAYVLDGIQSPFLTLTPGRTYRFKQDDNTNSNHPLRFYLEADKTTQYTTNVTTNGTAGSSGAYTQIVVSDETPVVLHYQCSAHGYMGNAIANNSNVVNTNYAATIRNSLDVSGSIAGFDDLRAPYSATTKTYTVTVASKDSTHRYNGQGSGNAYLIDGVQSPVLFLTPGRTYRFTNDNTGSHPLKFYLEADKTTNYVTGVNFQNTYTEITVGDETPNVLHYQCTAHSLMGNAIVTNSNVVNSNYAGILRGGLNVSGGESILSSATVSDLTSGRVVYAGGSGALQDSGNLVFNGTDLSVASLIVSDLTDGRVVLAGGSGAVEDNANLKFNTTTSEFEVVGHTVLDSVVTSGIATIGSVLYVGGTAGGTIQISNNDFLIDAPSGDEIFLRANGGDRVLAGRVNAETEIFYNNNLKLATSNTGINVTGEVTASGNINGVNGNFSGNVSIGGTLTYEDVARVDAVGLSTFREGLFIPDNQKAQFGNVAGNADLEIYHSGSHSFIDDTGTGNLKIRSNNLRISNGDESKIYATFTPSTVELYHDNSKKLETTSNGITASGTQHIFSSGTSGDCTVIIEADTDNNAENDNPKLVFKQDGGIEEAAIGMNFTNANNNSANEFFIANGINEGAIVVATGSTAGYQNSTERIRILQDGNIKITGDVAVAGVTTSTGGFVGDLTGDVTGNADTATLATRATDLAINGTNQLLYQASNNDSAILPTGNAGQILQSNGAGSAPQWVTSAPAGAIEGITVRDESNIVGSANSISTINFIGQSVTADAAVAAGIATVTIDAISGILVKEDTSNVGTAITAFDFSGSLVDVDAASNTGIATVQIDGLTVKDEGSTVGTAGSITTINFVGSGIAAAVSGDTATVTSAGGVTNADVVALAIALG